MTLRLDPFELELAPAAGGCVRAFRAAGRDVLRPAPNGPGVLDAPLDMAAFPQIPFAGRIAFGRFTFGGRAVTLPPNFPPEPHAIHGQAWQTAWAVGAVSATRAVLWYEHGGDVWPWRYRAEQCFELDGAGLSLRLALTNLSGEPMPAGFGWHPYFPRPGASLWADVGARWAFDPATLAPTLAEAPGSTGLNAQVADLVLDDAFQAGPGGARLAWPRAQVTLTASAVFESLVLFVPEGQDYFCVEPVSHVPNAVNSPLPPALTGLRVLAPGQTLAGDVRLVVELQESGDGK